MRKLTLVATVLLIIGMTSTVFAGAGSSFGCLTTASAMGQGKANFGFGLGLADNTSFVATGTLGLSKYTDGRLKIGLVDPDGADAEFTLGGDFKWQYWSMGTATKRPFDMAFGGFFEFADLGRLSVFQFGAQIIGSYPVALSGGGTLTPYGRFNARIEAISIDLPPGASGDDSKTDLELGFNGGVKWQVSSGFAFFGEFQIDGNDGIFLGFDLSMM